MWALWGVQHSLGPFLGPISIPRAFALFYGTTDTLRVSYTSFESNKDKLIDQVSQLEGTCSKLRDEVMGVLSSLFDYHSWSKANYMSAVSALRAMSFPLLGQLESYKDASIADLMGLLHLEGPTTETPEAIQLNVASQQLSIFDALVPLIEPLSAKNLVGETSTYEVPPTTIPLVPVIDHGVLDVGTSTKVPSPSKIMFEKEELETTPEHTAALLSLL
nr:hypothetical protein [Tanacetum cinerariifolium]